MDELSGFVLTRAWREERGGLEYTLWLSTERGPLRAVITGQEAVFFAHRSADARAVRREPLELTSLDGREVDGLYFHSLRALRDEAERLRRNLVWPLEADVKPLERFLMERFVTGGVRARGELIQREGFLEMRNPQLKAAEHEPALRLASLDIETDGGEGPVLSIAWIADGSTEPDVLMVGDPVEVDHVAFFPDERALLRAFVARLRRDDPDVIVGWSVVEFDLAWLEQRCDALGVPFLVGRAGERGTVLPSMREGQPAVARVPGRVVLDGVATMRSATWTFESWRLDHVAETLLGRKKQIASHVDPVEEIRRMFREDKPALAAYNREDARLVLDIFAHADLIGFTVARQRMTGLPMDRQGGAVAAFDHLYLPRLHRHGHVAPDVGESVEPVTSPGGYVLESRPGLYDNVLVLDFKSLYPSIIRTFCIDPMGMAFPGDDPVEGFGAKFHRTRHILPGLIESLWKERDAAKQQKNAALSQAIKILMNSFYGVLGTPGCRFFSPHLASSITRRGHEIITRTRDFIEDRALPVIYGDTDSLFVLLGPGRDEADCRHTGAELTRDLNAWWRERIAEEHRVESALEIQFETHYLKFLMPTLRHSERGTKKRYAGSVRTRDGGTRIVVKGLEAARTDWTPLARRFQRELFRRVFAGEPWEELVRGICEDVRAGKLDEELAYRKRLRRRIEEYGESAPPHVQAARKLGVAVREISYYMTVAGPEPVGRVSAALDYEHYVDKQLAPAADVILSFLGTDLARVAGRQMSLF